MSGAKTGGSMTRVVIIEDHTLVRRVVEQLGAGAVDQQPTPGQDGVDPSTLLAERGFTEALVVHAAQTR